MLQQGDFQKSQMITNSTFHPTKGFTEVNYLLQALLKKNVPCKSINLLSKTEMKPTAGNKQLPRRNEINLETCVMLCKMVGSNVKLEM